MARRFHTAVLLLLRPGAFVLSLLLLLRPGVFILSLLLILVPLLRPGPSILPPLLLRPGASILPLLPPLRTGASILPLLLLLLNPPPTVRAWGHGGGAATVNTTAPPPTSKSSNAFVLRLAWEVWTYFSMSDRVIPGRTKLVRCSTSYNSCARQWVSIRTTSRSDLRILNADKEFVSPWHAPIITWGLHPPALRFPRTLSQDGPCRHHPAASTRRSQPSTLPPPTQ